jgi:thiamine pyrophosphate-dependent acetolactate synthase large subunit-like protein
MRELVARYLSNAVSRRDFVRGLIGTGLTVAAAQSVLRSADAIAQSRDGAPLTPEDIRIFEGPAGAAFAEQLIASGVRYVFGGSDSEDAEFYDALVDRPQLQFILTTHEGPGAAMAAGYIKASGQPALVTQAAAIGLMNATGQIFNAFKEQTPLVVYSARAEDSREAGRDAFQEFAGQEQMLTPLTKWAWTARRAEMIPETVRRAFKVAWTPPYGPTYVNWHEDFNHEKIRTEIITHDRVDPRMRVRPNPSEVERAARLLVEARNPLLIVGDEIYKAKAFAKVVQLAELLALPVTQARQVFANFPQDHPLWISDMPGGRIETVAYPRQPDLVINVGNKMQHNSPTPMVPRTAKFIDLRIDSTSMGNVMATTVPLVADVGYGLDDLLAALNGVMTPAITSSVQERFGRVRAFSENARRLRRLVSQNPDWDRTPMLPDRVSYELAQWADANAVVVHEGGSLDISHSFAFNPLTGRDLFFYFGGHLGSGVGTAAGVKLARPDRQVVCLVGDGSFIFGPTALWNMARLELPVLVIVYNNHAYGGPHNRVLSLVPGGRMVQTGHFLHSYLGKPDMDMSAIAKGFGVAGEKVRTPVELKAALARSKSVMAEGKPYLIDAEVARYGIGWTDQEPWVPPNRRT